MSVVRSIEQLRERVAAWRAAGERVALVPTMGNLHAGHLALVEAARRRADRTVVSIFVNPLQFGPGEDLDAYPRTEVQDVERLAAVGNDLVFAPSAETMYGRTRAEVAFVEVPGLSEELCGAARPGHFRGVATVVAKLFNIVQPQLAIFGLKDYQQFLVIRRMVEDLCFPVELLGLPTVREADGLAMSSRNAYLGDSERRQAPALYQTLCAIGERLAAGERDYARLETFGSQQLAAAGLQPEYVAIRRAEDLERPAPDTRTVVILAAARLGKARLIDNILAPSPGGS